MSGWSRGLKLMPLILLMLACSLLWAQGPPYETEDPVPVDLHHYEFCIFGGVDGTPAQIDSTGPAFEFNWGAIPRVQLHTILPWGLSFHRAILYTCRGNGSERIRSHGHGTWCKTRHHQGDPAHPANRHLHDF